MLELVHLNVESGEVVVSGKIDRERFSWINLTARATDSGTPRRSSFVPVLIQVTLCDVMTCGSTVDDMNFTCAVQVLDENDNNPQFAQGVSNYSVRENATPGMTFI